MREEFETFLAKFIDDNAPLFDQLHQIEERFSVMQARFTLQRPIEEELKRKWTRAWMLWMGN